MNWTVFVIECVVLMAVFGCLVFGMLLANPLTFISDYPLEIQERYYRSQHKEASKAALTKLMVVKKVTALIVCSFLFAWMAHIAGAVTFLEGLFTIYGYILVWAHSTPACWTGCCFPISKGFVSPVQRTWTRRTIRNGSM